VYRPMKKDCCLAIGSTNRAAILKAVSLSHLLAVFAGWHDACP